jgi:hypothetical protein
LGMVINQNCPHGKKFGRGAAEYGKITASEER